MGKGSGTTQTTQETNYGPWISDAQKAALGIAGAQNGSTAARGISPYSHAGFNMDQMKGFDSIRSMLDQWGPGSNNGAGAQGMLGQVNGYLGQGTNAKAAQLGPTDYQQFMSPYINDVLVPATNELQRQTETARAGMGARDAAAGAYGGSRGALGNAQLDRSMQETGSQLVANEMAKAYNQAQQLAEGNTNRQQQTNMQNANNSMQGANTMINSAGMLDSLLNSDFNRGRNVISDLIASGAFQQNDMQNYLNEPLDALARIFQYVPQKYDSTVTQTSPDNSPSFLQQLLGVALTGLPGGSINGTTSTANLLY